MSFTKDFLPDPPSKSTDGVSVGCLYRGGTTVLIGEKKNWKRGGRKTRGRQEKRTWTKKVGRRGVRTLEHRGDVPGIFTTHGNDERDGQGDVVLRRLCKNRVRLLHVQWVLKRK